MQPSQTILLDIYERLGAIENELKSLGKDHDETKAELTELQQFKAQIGAYIWLGGAIASGVLFLLWEGLRYGLDKWVFHH